MAERSNVDPDEGGIRRSRQRDASPSTIAAHTAALQQLAFDDIDDFAALKRGFVAPLPDGGLIVNAGGETVWDTFPSFA